MAQVYSLFRNKPMPSHLKESYYPQPQPVRELKFAIALMRILLIKQIRILKKSVQSVSKKLSKRKQPQGF